MKGDGVDFYLVYGRAESMERIDYGQARDMAMSKSTWSPAAFDNSVRMVASSETVSGHPWELISLDKSPGRLAILMVPRGMDPSAYTQYVDSWTELFASTQELNGYSGYGKLVPGPGFATQMSSDQWWAFADYTDAYPDFIVLEERLTSMVERWSRSASIAEPLHGFLDELRGTMARQHRLDPDTITGFQITGFKREMIGDKDDEFTVDVIGETVIDTGPAKILQFPSGRRLNGYGAPMRRSHVPLLGTQVRWAPTSSFEVSYWGREGLLRGMTGQVTQARPPSDDPVCDPEGRMVAVLWDTGAPNPPNLCVPIHALEIVSRPSGYEGYGQQQGDIEDLAELKRQQTMRMPYWEPEDGSDRENWATFIGHHRDSSALEESNWQVVTRDLMEDFPEDTEIVRFGHFAVGWIEELFVRIRDRNGQITPAFLAGVAWIQRLDEYPVADEEHFAMLEEEMGISD